MKITKLVINNSRLMNDLFTGKYIYQDSINDTIIYENGGKKDTKLTIEVSICKTNNTGNQNVEEEITTLKPFDRIILDSIYSILKAKQEDSKSDVYFTLGELIHTVTGDDNAPITFARKKMYKESIERLRNIQVYLDITNELTKRGLAMKSKSDGDYTIGPCSLLPITTKYQFKNEDKISKRDTTRYYLDQEDRQLPLYEYAEKIKQLITFYPFMLFEKPLNAQQKRRYSNEEAIFIKWYLVRRIEQMHSARNRNLDDGEGLSTKTILLSHVLKSLGKKKPTNHDQKDFIKWKKTVNACENKVCHILDYFVEIGYIDEYNHSKKDGKFEIKNISEFKDLKIYAASIHDDDQKNER